MTAHNVKIITIDGRRDAARTREDRTRSKTIAAKAQQIAGCRARSTTSSKSRSKRTTQRRRSQWRQGSFLHRKDGAAGGEDRRPICRTPGSPTTTSRCCSPTRRGRATSRTSSTRRRPRAPRPAPATGGVLGGALGWLAGIGALAIPGVGPFIAAGPIMAALGGAAVGAAVGGLTGALVGMGIPEYEAKHYEGKIRERQHPDLGPHRRQRAARRAPRRSSSAPAPRTSPRPARLAPTDTLPRPAAQGLPAVGLGRDAETWRVSGGPMRALCWAQDLSQSRCSSHSSSVLRWYPSSDDSAASWPCSWWWS